MPATDPLRNLRRTRSLRSFAGPLLAAAAALGGCAPRANASFAALPRQCDRGLYADLAARTQPSDDDWRAVFAYLQSILGIRKKVAESKPPQPQ